MGKRKTKDEVLREIVGYFIEEAEADAVVILYSTVKHRRTTSYIVPFGNAHTCNGLIDFAYENYEPEHAEEDVEDE